MMTSQNRLFCRHFARILQNGINIPKHNIHISHWLSIRYTYNEKTAKNRRKTVVRKTQRILRRFFYVKKVSCTPFFKLRLILFYPTTSCIWTSCFSHSCWRVNMTTGTTFSEGVVNDVPFVVKNNCFCSLSAKRNFSLPHPDDINDMASCTDEVRTFGDEGLIFYEAGECGVAHSVEPCAHIVCCAVGWEYRHTLQSGRLVQLLSWNASAICGCYERQKPG